ncbi:hypothetical protein [Nostoc sp.]|uniref:hypothetical protein n=1 Tax=Nostoc sp. TaxID=1180 RepID=UPI002FF9725D
MLHQLNFPRFLYGDAIALIGFNEVTKKRQIAYAFPELPCTFGGRSIVPDVAVIRWQQIEFDDDGEPVDDVLIAPNWTI